LAAGLFWYDELHVAAGQGNGLNNAASTALGVGKNH
jgi:hypothetical protein